MVRIILDGKPVAKSRPRFTKRGFAYTPPTTVEYEKALKAEAESEMNGRPPMECPVRVRLEYWFPIPKSYSKKKREELIGQPHTKKPDLDNLVKTLDALNGVVFKDDSQIVDIRAQKMYGEVPYTIIEVTRDDIFSA